MAQADAAGVRPVSPGSAAFDEIANAGRMKFAVLETGELQVIPHTVEGFGEMSHAVISGGAPVTPAGGAEVAASAGSYCGLEITNWSGHFQPTLESLDVAREAFGSYGITLH